MSGCFHSKPILIDTVIVYRCVFSLNVRDLPTMATLCCPFIIALHRMASYSWMEVYFAWCLITIMTCLIDFAAIHLDNVMPCMRSNCRRYVCVCCVVLQWQVVGRTTAKRLIRAMIWGVSAFVRLINNGHNNMDWSTGDLCRSVINDSWFTWFHLSLSLLIFMCANDAKHMFMFIFIYFFSIHFILSTRFCSFYEM